MSRESQYQAKLIKKLTDVFPGCVVLKNDPNYIQGIPDLLILHRRNWAMLEVKASANAPMQFNQDYYVDLLSDMSFAAFICPENEVEVFRGLERALKA